MFGTAKRTFLRGLTSAAQRGFTLIEIAIVLVVIGLIVSGGLLAVSPVIQSAKATETKQKIATVEAALLAYVIQNGCLPCPAGRGSTATGISNTGGTPPTGDYTTACGSGGSCTGTGNGLVPWVTLGLSESDATDGWDRRLTYAVNPTVTDSSTDLQRTGTGSFPTIDESTTIIRIDNLSGTNQNYSGIAYVLVSHGQDGALGETRTGSTVADIYSQSGTNVGQAENADGDLRFAVGLVNNINSSSHFDDIVAFKAYRTLILSCGSGSCGNPS